MYKKAELDDKGLKPVRKQRIFDWFRDNKSKFTDVPPPPPPLMSPPPPPPLNGEDEVDDVHSEGAAPPAPSVAALSESPAPAS